MIEYLRRLWNWLKEAWLFWLALLVVAVSLLFAFGPGPSEPRIRITGLALQLLGISTVAWGIHQTRVLFGRPTIISVVRKRLSRLPKYRPRRVTGECHINLPSPIVFATGYEWINPPDASLDARITAMEENLKRVNERVDRTKDLLRQEVCNREDALNLERQAREKENQELSQKLEMSETGGLHISAMGLMWLALGLIMSTVTNEIVSWLR